MKLGRDVADRVVKQAVYEGVDVLVLWINDIASRDRRCDRVKAVADYVALAGRKNTGLAQRERPSLGELDVVGPKTKVDANGTVQRVECRRRRRRKTSAPELV
jgi:hypothetical protein